jgi:hypothetical protein
MSHTAQPLNNNLDNDEKLSQEWREHEDNGLDPNAIAFIADYVPGSPEEKAFVRKIDKRILPTIWALYVLSYLDRANIG